MAREAFYDERDSSSDMSCGEPDFVKLAESFGVKGVLNYREETIAK